MDIAPSAATAHYAAAPGSGVPAGLDHLDAIHKPVSTARVFEADAPKALFQTQVPVRIGRTMYHRAMGSVSW